MAVAAAGGPAAAAAPTAGRTDADYAQHVTRLKARLPPGFTVVVQKPFVVIGDEPSEVVGRRAEHTVKWAVDHLKARYFSKDPTHILDVWLFRDRRSYDKHVLALFGERPSTPYGYYSPSDRALVMNIATGGGTLVHEIVHPFIESNFPAAPAWFNEGLGSLYEQSAERAGAIHGLTNWRLSGLQDAIRAGVVPSFAKLTATTSGEFYDEDPGSNYGQARYLMYYLQQKGRLRAFYRAFHRHHAKDPTGYRTLLKVLGDPSPERFEREWRAFVLRLRFG